MQQNATGTEREGGRGREKEERDREGRKGKLEQLAKANWLRSALHCSATFSGLWASIFMSRAGFRPD